MKFSLRNMLLAVPCFAISVAIYVNYLRWLDAHQPREISGADDAERLREIAQGMSPGRCLNEGPAIAAALVGLAILFGYWRTAAVIAILAVVGSGLYLAGVIEW